MSSLLPARWQKQPQSQALSIDWSHPLARGLTGLWVLNNAKPYDLVSNEFIDASTIVNLGTYGKGKVAQTAFRTNKYPQDVFDTANAVGTMFVGYHSTRTAYPSTPRLFGARSGTSSTATSIFGNNAFDFGKRIYASFANIIGYNSLAITSGDHDLIKAHHNGKKIGEDAKATSIANQSVTLGFGLAESTTGSHLNGYVLATWDRALTDKEVKQLHENPYQLLATNKTYAVSTDSLNATITVDLEIPAFNLISGDNVAYLDAPAFDMEAVIEPVSRFRRTATEKRYWDKQPQTQSITIDRSHPLARGLKGLWIFNTKYPRNLVTGEIAVNTLASPPTQRVSKQGVGVNGALKLADDFSKFSNGNKGTLLYIGEGEEPTDRTYLMSAHESTSVVTHIAGGSGTQVLFNAWSKDRNTSNLTSTIPKDGFKNVIFTTGDFGRRFYSHGELDVGGSNQSSSVTNSGPLYLHSLDGTTLDSDSYANVVAAWDRPLTEAEAKEASQNIYQVLAPISRTFGFDPQNIVTTVDISLEMPCLAVSGDLIEVEPSQELVDIALPTPGFETSETIATGANFDVALSIDSQPDLAMTAYFYNDISIDFNLPRFVPDIAIAIDLSMDFEGAVGVPAIAATFEYGNAFDMALELPAFGMTADFAHSIALDGPAVDVSGAFIAGRNAAGSLGIPAPDLSVQMSTQVVIDADANLVLPKFKVSADILLNNAIHADLSLPKIKASGVFQNGVALTVDLDVPVFNADILIDMAQSQRTESNLIIPMPGIEANLFTISRNTRFYNRNTR